MIEIFGNEIIVTMRRYSNDHQLRKDLEYDLTFPDRSLPHGTYIPPKDKKIFDPKCPLCIKFGSIPEYRYIWWQHHKTEDILPYEELIHHINGNHQDNRPENLEKITWKEHKLKHIELRRLKKLGHGGVVDKK